MERRVGSKRSLKDDCDMQFDVTINDACNQTRRIRSVERVDYTIDDVKEIYENNNNKSSSKFSAPCKRTFFTCKNLWALLLSFFPIIQWLPKYKVKANLLRDVSAGITLGIIQIPQGMAYGMLTTLPPIYGLYTSLIPAIIYMCTGTSRHLNIGTFAIVSLMVGEVVEKGVSAQLGAMPTNGTLIPMYAAEEADIRVKIAVVSSFTVGVIQICLGMLHVSFVSVFLSDPLISGFTTGAAFHIFSSQVRHLVGMSIPRKEASGIFAIFKLYIYIFSNIKSVNIGSLAIGVIASIILYVIKYLSQKYKNKIKFPIPAELIVVILGTGLSYGFKFHQNYEIKILKKVPTGLPPLSVPDFSLMKDLITDCLVISIVSFAINISIAKAFAKKNKYIINPTQELYAYGLSNIVSSFFSCFVSSGSLSRSLVQETLGSTQIASLLSGVLVILVLTVIAPLFEPLPNAILAAIVLITLKGLFMQFTVVKTLLKVSKKDAMVWILSFTAVICLGVDYGLAVSLIINLIMIVYMIVRPSFSMLKNLKTTEIFMNGSHDQLVEYPGIKIFQFCAPLIYANVEFFQEQLYKHTVDPDTCVSIRMPQSFQLHNEVDENGCINNSSSSYDVKAARSFTHSAPVNNHEERLVTKSGSLDSPIELCTQTLFTKSQKLLRCPLHTVILDFSQIPYLDTMGISTLLSVCSDFTNVGVEIYLANFSNAVYHTFTVGGFIKTHHIENFFPSIQDAVFASRSKMHMKGVVERENKHHNMDLSYEVVTAKGSNATEELLSSTSSSNEDCNKVV